MLFSLPLADRDQLIPGKGENLNPMSEAEFDILDELYFVISFEELQEKVQMEEEVLKLELGNLIRKGWVRVLEKKSDNSVEDLHSFNKNYKFYNYLASKEGLLAHNSR